MVGHDRASISEKTVAELECLIGDSATLADAIVPFRALLASGALLEAVERDLEILRAGASIGRQAPAGQLHVLATAGLRVRGQLVRPQVKPPAVVSVLTRNTLIGNAGTTALRLGRFRQPRPEPNDVFDPARLLEFAGENALEPGEPVALRAGIDAYTLSAHDRPGIALLAAGPYAVDLEWHHDRVTLRPRQLQPVHNSWLRLRELLRFGEALGLPGLIDGLEDLAAHPSHFIRWSAARLAVRLQPERGMRLMQALTADPHPQLQAAARKICAEHVV